MAHSLQSTEHQEQRRDNLTEIHGLGPAIEQKLNQDGVFTFSQLANISTEKLAALFSHMPGWSAERGRDLIDQARNLMGKEAMVSDSASDNNTQYLAQFSIVLLLDNQRHVRRTQITHVPSGTPAEWPDWNEANLTDFVLKNAKIKPKPNRIEKGETKATLQSLPADKKQATTKERASDLSISDVEIQTKSGAVTRWLVKAEEAFAVRLSLNMSRSSISLGMPLQYKAEVYIQNPADGNRQNIGNNKGPTISKDLLPLTIDCHALPQGSYCMEVSVILSPAEKDADPKFRLEAITQGKVFSVS